MLACVFGAERFHTYVFGRSFTIESDHKPLEQINLKNLTDTPARLQRMLLHLQNYDVKDHLLPRTERCWLLTPYLDYAPLTARTGSCHLHLAIHHMHITPEKKLAFPTVLSKMTLSCRSLAENHHCWMA